MFIRNVEVITEGLIDFGCNSVALLGNDEYLAESFIERKLWKKQGQ